MAIRVRSLLILASLLLVACSSTPPSTPLPSSAVGRATPSGSSAGPVSSASAEPAAQLPPTSEKLIAEALAAGTIDFETSIRYRAYALYGDPRLPEAYQSPVRDYEAGAGLAADVEVNRAKLGADLLADVAPLLARPNDPASVFSHAAPTSEIGRIVAAQRVTNDPLGIGSASGMSDHPTVRTATATWISASAAGGDARIWIREFPGAEAVLDDIAKTVVTPIWPMLRRFFRAPLPDAGKPANAINPDAAIDIYLVEYNTVDPRSSYCASHPNDRRVCQVRGYLGMAPRDDPRFDNKSSGYALIKIDQDRDALRATIAHELMHDAQFAFDNGETAWLDEATAEWGAFRILHELGWSVDCTQCSHSFLDDFYLRFPSGAPLTTEDSEYGAYLYFYFAQMEQGDDVVAKVWQAAAAPDQQGERAVDQVLPFSKSLPAFALQTWNAEPVAPLYRNERDPSFPEALKPFDYLGRTEISLTETRTAPLQADVEQLGTRYFHFDFLDKNVRQVIFHDTLVGNPSVAVQALVRIGDVWQKPRDWTGQDKVTFCRDAPDQDVRELVVIISNSDLTKPLAPAGDPTIEGKPEPCGHYAGTVTKSFTRHSSAYGISDVENGSISASVTWEVDPAAAQDANHAVVWKPVAGQLAWQYKGTFTVPRLTCIASGSGSVPFTSLSYSDLGYSGRDGYLVTWTDTSGQRLYGANGVIISREDAFPIKWSCVTPLGPAGWSTDWLTTTSDPDQEPPYGGIPVGENGAISGTYTKDRCTGPTDVGATDTCTWTWDFELAP